MFTFDRKLICKSAYSRSDTVFLPNMTLLTLKNAETDSALQHQNPAIRTASGILKMFMEHNTHLPKVRQARFNMKDKRFIVMPIVKSSHWKLQIFASSSNGRESHKLLHLNSLGGPGKKSSKIVRCILNKINNANKEPLYGSSDFSREDSVENIVINVPIQKNYYDCGFYLLCFVKYFLKDPELVLRNQIDFEKDWIPESELTGMRDEMKAQLMADIDEYKRRSI